jgi:hypothetical protein
VTGTPRVGGFFLKEPNCEAGASPSYIAVTIGTGETHEKSRRLHARRTALKYVLVRFAKFISVRLLHGGYDRLRQGTVFWHRLETQSAITHGIVIVGKLLAARRR